MAVSVRFRCTACLAERMIAQQAVGRRIRCPDCGNLVKVSAETTARPEQTQTTTWNPPPEADAPDSKAEETLSGVAPVSADPAGHPQPSDDEATATPVEGELVELDAPAADPLETDQSSDDATAVDFSDSPRAGEGEMDMTPMVDVTFLLLIFFMVTASFAMQRSIPMPTQQESEPSTEVRTLDDFLDDEDYVVVRIDAFSTYHVFAQDWDKEAPSAHELLIQLRRARTPSRRAPVPNRLLVIANGDALYEKVVVALDAGTEVGMENVQLITVEDDEL